MVQKSRKDKIMDAEPEVVSSEVSPKDQGDDTEPAREARFPVVGVGASAGGLEALEQFLKNVPENCGMAFVIVQHLDPTHIGIMPELLQRATAMKVIQVRERQHVEPNCVYVIPPNKDMSILHGVLHLMEPMAPRGLRLPIDSFLRSLAEDLQDAAVGVILSGMGSDGTLGLRAIKEKAGLALVQDPASARFDGMPRSAIGAGLADIVAPAEELAPKIIAYIGHTPVIVAPESPSADKGDGGLEQIITLLRSHTGHDFFQYKKSTLYRRIERRMGIHQIDKIGRYVRYLQENTGEVDLLFHELLIGVTSFFRDPEEWDRLRDVAITNLLNDGSPRRELRAWVVGCSTGEEAYSLAIVFKEALEKLKPQGIFTLQIFATDLDRYAIDRARSGTFPINIAADVSQERLSRFFTEENGSYVVNKEIREMVIFAPQNVIKDPPFTKLDIVTCRNMLIYMEADLQKMVLRLLHYSLMPDGVMLLGSAESVAGLTDYFRSVEDKSRIYKRLEPDVPLAAMDFPRVFTTAHGGARHVNEPPVVATNLQSLADQLLLQTYSPAAVLVNNKGDVLYISGRTGKYLEPAPGKANWNIFVMAREGMRYEIVTAFQKALRQKEKVVLRSLTFQSDSRTQTVDISIQVVENPEQLRGLVMIVFTEVEMILESVEKEGVKRATRKNSQLARAESELMHVHEELRGVREEMQSSQEELISTNEEMQSNNEELQSTNEELTTSREEMQSMNEELQTVNNELQSKLEELSRTSADMNNLLNSTDIATVFLDSGLLLRRFTSEAIKILRLIPGDVGRPFTDISSDLIYPDLPADAHEVLRTLVFSEKQVSASDERWFAVRIMPYRTQDNRIDGVVITLTNITEAKKTHDALQDAEHKFHDLFEKSPVGIAYHEMIFDAAGEPIDYRFINANESYRELTGVDPRGKTARQAFPGIENDPSDWIGTFGRVVQTGETIRFEQHLQHNDCWYDCVAYQSAPGHFVAAFTNITERKRAEEALRDHETKESSGKDANL